MVLCTIEAVWLGTTGGTDGIAQPGLPVLERPVPRVRGQRRPGLALRSLHEAPRHQRGARAQRVRLIVGAAKVVEEVVAGAKTVAFA